MFNFALFPIWQVSWEAHGALRIGLRGRIFSQDSVVRSVGAAAAREVHLLCANGDDARSVADRRAHFNRVAKPFTTDGLGGRRVVLRVWHTCAAGVAHRMVATITDSHGTFNVAVILHVHDAGDPAVVARTLTVALDGASGMSSTRVLCPRHLAAADTAASPPVIAICDIDDTIKVSSVLDRQALLQNTFFRPFVAVPGMAGALASLDVPVHYVSASPWQLLGPLTEFLQAFPTPHLVHLRALRARNPTGISAFVESAAGAEHKTRVINDILVAYPPDTRAILIGDVGERDWAVYREVLRRRPQQVVTIMLRTLAAKARPDNWKDDPFQFRVNFFSDSAELARMLHEHFLPPPPLAITPGCRTQCKLVDQPKGHP
jgi:phosphatidate phosphatase APP1